MGSLIAVAMCLASMGHARRVRMGSNQSHSRLVEEVHKLWNRDGKWYQSRECGCNPAASFNPSGSRACGPQLEKHSSHRLQRLQSSFRLSERLFRARPLALCWKSRVGNSPKLCATPPPGFLSIRKKRKRSDVPPVHRDTPRDTGFPSASGDNTSFLDSLVELAEFVSEVSSSIHDGTFVSLTLKHNAAEHVDTATDIYYLGTDGGSNSLPFDFFRLKRVEARIVEIKKGARLQLTLKYQHRDITRNVKFAEVASTLEQCLAFARFRYAQLRASTSDLSVNLETSGQIKLQRKPPTQKQPPLRTHDVQRPTLVRADAPFLQALGLSNADGSPRPRMSAKRRQIEKFVETIAALVRTGVPSSLQQLRIVDVGCGRGYLTFATHAHFAREGRGVQTRGIEVRRDLIRETNSIASELADGDPAFSSLRFVESTIEDYLRSSVEEGLEVDVLIALHACDTATDDALWCGVKNGARVIVTAPCCQKELRPQLEGMASSMARDAGEEGHPLWPSLRHGIYRERMSEMATDSMRALLLEIANYDVKVFEFVGGDRKSVV